MRNFVIPAFLLMCTINVGCSSDTKQSYQLLAVYTPGAEGAICQLTASNTGTYNVKTPGNLVVPKGHTDITVTCSKECFEDTGGVIQSRMAGAMTGHIILGGETRADIDAPSGAMIKYDPSITIHMKKLPGC